MSPNFKAILILIIQVTNAKTIIELTETFQNAYDNFFVENPMTDLVRVISQTDMDQINNYGCYCYFEENHGKGKGVAQDSIDRICKTLHDGYECIMMDQAELGNSCTPWTVQYNSTNGAGFSPSLQSVIDSCESQNDINDLCAIESCKVEAYFISNLVNYFVSGGLIDDSLKHENGFDVDSQCRTRGSRNNGNNNNNNNGQSNGSNGSSGAVVAVGERKCCGDYPTRFVYHDLDGERGCCAGRTYNTISLQCCNDGTTAVTCN